MGKSQEDPGEEVVAKGRAAEAAAKPSDKDADTDKATRIGQQASDIAARLRRGEK